MKLMLRIRNLFRRNPKMCPVCGDATWKSWFLKCRVCFNCKHGHVKKVYLRVNDQWVDVTGTNNPQVRKILNHAE